ncbi:carbohydrate sulfotransferase 6-like [Nematolebias whitei]|uniref:carbohydrate sulfotransferase 6-like n=1 Tax=Nematolebias whitei TaxID=451745 RepID=UPI001899B77C|nr:carbohydrate sulfotransferase 6-like [Nematolebias whitei]
MRQRTNPDSEEVLMGRNCRTSGVRPSILRPPDGHQTGRRHPAPRGEEGRTGPEPNRTPGVDCSTKEKTSQTFSRLPAMRLLYRVNAKILILLLVLQGASVLLYSSWRIQHNHGSTKTERKVHVLLLSSWRSGSSFLGQVFSQHPSVFYLMEPAWHVWTQVQKPGARVLRMAVRDILRSVFQCDFSVMDAYLPENPHVSSLFMWTESRALCSPPACSLRAKNETQCRQKCNVQGLQKVQASCRVHSHVALKETRVFELESLYPLLQDPKLDLRIVHLVRDPRAVLRSREESAKSLLSDNFVVLDQGKIPADEVQYKVMQEICRSHLRIHETAILKPPPFLKNRYKMVRYEDVTRNPLKEVSSIYEFVGLKMTKEMKDWIYKQTHGKGKGTRKQAFQIISRNATLVSQAWRTMLPFSKVKRVQAICRGAMELLGYRSVHSLKAQRSLDLDLLVSQEPYRFMWEPSKAKLKDKS